MSFAQALPIESEKKFVSKAEKETAEVNFEVRILNQKKKFTTLHMPQRTNKIFLVRLTANKDAFLFQLRVFSFDYA